MSIDEKAKIAVGIANFLDVSIGDNEISIGELCSILLTSATLLAERYSSLTVKDVVECFNSITLEA